MPSDIILIGPIGTGKSTIGALLSQHLQMPQVSMDQRRWDYYAEIGYDKAIAKHKREVEGFLSLYQYWKPFEIHAVERLLADHRNCIIDFGAGHSVYEEPTRFARVQTALAAYSNVVLLLPSPDLQESLQILNDRNQYIADGSPNINEHFLTHPANRTLAKHTIYTKGKRPEETCHEVLGAITDTVSE